MEVKNFKKYINNKDEKAQASIEFALLIPLIIFIILAVSQAGILLYQKNIIGQAAREGSRIIAVTDSNKEAEKIIKKICGKLDWSKITMKINPNNGRKTGDIVEVKISYKPQGFTSIIEQIIGQDFIIDAKSYMRMECY